MCRNFLHVLIQDGVTPLTVAIDKGHTEVVDTLLKYGADPNLTPTVPTHSMVHRVEVILLLGGILCSAYAYMYVLCQVPIYYISMNVTPMHDYSKVVFVLIKK